MTSDVCRAKVDRHCVESSTIYTDMLTLLIKPLCFENFFHSFNKPAFETIGGL